MSFNSILRLNSATCDPFYVSSDAPTQAWHISLSLSLSISSYINIYQSGRDVNSIVGSPLLLFYPRPFRITLSCVLTQHLLIPFFFRSSWCYYANASVLKGFLSVELIQFLIFPVTTIDYLPGQKSFFRFPNSEKPANYVCHSKS